MKLKKKKGNLYELLQEKMNSKENQVFRANIFQKTAKQKIKQKKFMG